MNQTPFFRQNADLVIITGLSGAGKSSAMRFLEDLGCYCVDNLPPSLIPTFYNLYQQSGTMSQGVVIASDLRSGALFDEFETTVNSLRASGASFYIVYLDCATDRLISRFKEVRRNHPLHSLKGSTQDAIEEERRRLDPIRALATNLIDTSDLSPAELRKALVKELIAEESSHVMTLDFVSFGFKYGLPRDVDFLFDLRFLPNPFYISELRPKTGEHIEVYRYVMKQPLSDPFFDKLVELIDLTVESFIKVGKTSLTIGLGCTGGRHRSVAFAMRLADYFRDRGRKAHTHHRDAAKPQG